MTTFQHATVYIKDKSGKKFFNTLCSPEYTTPEIRNMQRHLDIALKNPKAYNFIDLASARIYENDVPVGACCSMTDDELLAELMS